MRKVPSLQGTVVRSSMPAALANFYFLRPEKTVSRKRIDDGAATVDRNVGN